MDRKILWFYFSRWFGFSSKKTNNLINKMGSIDSLFSAPFDIIKSDRTMTDIQKEKIIKPDFDECKRQIAKLENQGISVISIDDPHYPPNLRNISNPPYILYCRGDKSCLTHSYPISIVGTRNPDTYGQKAAKTISSELSSMGAIIVSGLADGCDRISHKGALSSGGKTIAVSACGLDIDYPSQSAQLKKEIMENGAIITEFPLGYPVRRENFNVRNRIVSGVSLATIVIQAKLKSGTMLTANHAMNQNRDVYAVSGDVFSPLTEGPLSLIRDGATPFSKSSDIISHYLEIYNIPLIFPDKIKTSTNTTNENSTIKIKSAIPDYLSKEQKNIILTLRDKPLQIDELSSKLETPPYKLLALLTELEILSLIEALPGGIYKAI